MTSTTEDEPLILKTDALGRVRMPKARREAILNGFERSGMSGQAFAKRIGVKYPTFASWIQQRRRERGDYVGKEGKTVKACGVSVTRGTIRSFLTEWSGDPDGS